VGPDVALFENEESQIFLSRSRLLLLAWGICLVGRWFLPFQHGEYFKRFTRSFLEIPSAFVDFCLPMDAKLFLVMEMRSLFILAEIIVEGLFDVVE
jgi:hypothetical protein